MNNGCYDKPEYKLKQRLAKLGKNNPAYVDGKSRGKYEKIYNPIKNSLLQQCSICGITKKLMAHHLDGNYMNNELNNITIVCRGCHNSIHKTKKVE